MAPGDRASSSPTPGQNGPSATTIAQGEAASASSVKEHAYERRYIDDKSSALEIGCGRGFFAEKLNAKKYVGLELSQDSVQAARNKDLEVPAESIQDHARSIGESTMLFVDFRFLSMFRNSWIF